MSFILSIESLRHIYSVYSISSKFIFATESVIEEIGSNELKAAGRSLNDMKTSGVPERELTMAVTQLRSALEHFDSKSHGLFATYSAMRRRFQTALLISICYFAIKEQHLCEQYRLMSVKYFDDWLEEFSNGCPSGKLYNQERWYNETKSQVKDLGLSWPYSYPDSGFFGGFSSKASKRFHEAFENHKSLVKQQYYDLTKKLTS